MIRFLVACGLLFQGLLLRAEGRDLKAFYQARCSVCHGLDGSGKGPGGIRLGGRNLADSRWLAKQEEAALMASLLRGRGAMPGFQRQLGEAEAKRLLTEVVRPMATRRKS
jgi:mono/diheme cytochrome c family protein